jgi:hypothetical protein
MEPDKLWQPKQTGGNRKPAASPWIRYHEEQRQKPLPEKIVFFDANRFEGICQKRAGTPLSTGS